MKYVIKNKFENFYLKNEGAFCYYPGSKEATLEGTNDSVSLLDLTGALSSERQHRLWGTPDQNMTDLGIFDISDLKPSDLAIFNNLPDLNSLRFYRIDPGSDNFSVNVICLNYPQQTQVLDIMDLTPKLRNWLNTTSQTMGNWTSKEAIAQELEAMTIEPVPVLKEELLLNQLNKTLRDNGELVIIGFDVLQIPRYKIILRIQP